MEVGGAARRGGVHRIRRISLGPVVMAAAMLATAATAEDEPLAGLDIEGLMGIEVTSVSKKAQPLSQAPAAIYVITNERLRRSGVRTLPEALRMVPGMNVASVDGNTWAISARGFQQTFATKLLVLIDGRAVYTPLFAGTYWDVQNLLLEDVDRIEVIRGPGATIWGANAVNGVINIVTKNAAKTHGNYAEGGSGTIERGFAAVRHGGEVGEDLHYRFDFKYDQREDLKGWNYLNLPPSTIAWPSNFNSHDGSETFRGSGRVDWFPTPDDAVSVSAAAYGGDFEQTTATTVVTNTPPLYLDTPVDRDTKEAQGAHLLARWQRILGDASDLSIQTYYDYTDREDPTLGQRLHTIDFEGQHRVQLAFQNSVVEWAELLWGMGYRRHWNEIYSDSQQVTFQDKRDNYDLFSMFLQGEVPFFQDKFRTSAGLKIERHEFSGWEFQPSVRGAYKPTENHTIWGSVSRAVRAPSFADNGIVIEIGVPFVNNPGNIPTPPATEVPPIRVFGSTNSDSENMVAFELGYRGLLAENASLDVALFYNRYDDLTTGEATGPDIAYLTPNPFPPPPFFPLTTPAPTVFRNKGEAETYGVEVAAEYRPFSFWTMNFTYSFIELDLHTQSGSTDSGFHDEEEQTPNHQVSFRSGFDVPGGVELDAMLYWVDDLTSTLPGGGRKTVDDYFRLDLRVAWRPVEQVELELVGMNLVKDKHAEFIGQNGLVGTRIPRSVYGAVSIDF